MSNIKTAVLAFTLVIGMATASAAHAKHQKQVEENKPSIPDVTPDTPVKPGDLPKVKGKPSTAPKKGISGALNFLPGQAGSTARNVLNVIDTLGSGQALGEALSNLLAGNNTSVQTGN